MGKIIVPAVDVHQAGVMLAVKTERPRNSFGWEFWMIRVVDNWLDKTSVPGVVCRVFDIQCSKLDCVGYFESIPQLNAVLDTCVSSGHAVVVRSEAVSVYGPKEKDEGMEDSMALRESTALEVIGRQYVNNCVYTVGESYTPVRNGMHVTYIGAKRAFPLLVPSAPEGGVLTLQQAWSVMIGGCCADMCGDEELCLRYVACHAQPRLLDWGTPHDVLVHEHYGKDCVTVMLPHNEEFWLYEKSFCALQYEFSCLHRAAVELISARASARVLFCHERDDDDVAILKNLLSALHFAFF